jgi:metallo-beta-lactamase family protein
MRISFLGGAGSVTGSNFFVQGKTGSVIVDCGLEQGADFSVEDAYKPFPAEVVAANALVVTHAHLDHVGRIPKLVREGFRGTIYLTGPTRDLAALILEDSVHILGEDAKRRDLPPLYEEKDVAQALALMEPIGYHQEVDAAPGLSVYLRQTGHILGSASVRILEKETGRTLAFTGDIGNAPSPLLPDWEPIQDADVLFMESVYGDRVHPAHADRVQRLHDTLSAAIARGGTILIPAFSIERTQIMLYEISNFFSAKSLPTVPVYLDSPLGIRVTDVYEKWGSAFFNQAAEREMKIEKSLFDFPFLTKTLSREDSREIELDHRQKIIIAGAGMSHGGRIGYWEEKYLPSDKTSLLIVGYQAPGSPGRRMQEGAGTVRLGHKEVSMRAHVEILEGWSGHADRDGLLDFAHAALTAGRTKTILIGLGEPSAERFLAQRIHDYLDATALVPQRGEVWEVGEKGASRVRA